MENLLLFLVEGPGIDLNAVGAAVEELGNPLQIVEDIERRNVPKNENFYEVTIPQYMGDLFREHFRMSREAFTELTRIVGQSAPHMQAPSIPLEKKIMFTVWVISNPETFLAAGDRFGMARSTAHYVFQEIIGVLLLLLPIYIRWPENFNTIEEAFYARTHIPGVVGAVDGCHIEIKQPANNANDYYNRNNYHSIILQGICDHNMRFTDIFVGIPGRVHDARVFRNSPIYEQINNLPRILHVLADSAYPLTVNVITPFRDNGHLNRIELNFNTIISSARSVIERAFGRLKGKFRRLKYLDISDPDFGCEIITAACVLHNFIISTDGEDDEEFDLDIGVANDFDKNVNNENENAGAEKRRELSEHLWNE